MPIDVITTRTLFFLKDKNVGDWAILYAGPLQASWYNNTVLAFLMNTHYVF
jgi:hypothetical protein